MRTLLSTVILLTWLGTTSANAASCDERARALAASQGGTVVSVRADGDLCVVKLLIRSNDGPPVRRTIRIGK